MPELQLRTDAGGTRRFEVATLITRATLFPEYAVVSISDTVPGELPNWPGPPAVVAGTDSNIAVYVRPAVDGDITVELTNDETEFTVHEGVREYFHGELLTPSRRVHVFIDAEMISILDIPVSGGRSLVRIWGNAERDASWVGVLVTGLVALPGEAR
jgi:hypothetical protein